MINKKNTTHINLRVFMSTSIGNVLEFYDFATYGFLIPIMAPLFFPTSNPINSLLLAFSVFAISFIVRPVGGIIFGYIGDTYGRKKAFSSSLILMASATSIIGVLPVYEKIGILSPILLILCRLMQGLCLGGEFSGSLIFASEHIIRASAKRPSFITACITAAGVSGWFLSSLICSLCININLFSLSWRIPFLLGSTVGIVGYYIRRSLPDSPVELNRSVNIWAIIKSEWLTVISIASIGALMGGIFYGIQIFPNSFLPTHFPFISHVTALRCTTFGIGVYMVFLPFMGYVADIIGHTKLMKLFCYLSIFLSFPILFLLFSGDVAFILLAEFLASFTLAGFMAPATFVMTQNFLPVVRYRLVSFSYNLGASLIGGLTPIMFLFLLENIKSFYAPGIYIIICSLFGLYASYYLEKYNFLESK